MARRSGTILLSTSMLAIGLAVGGHLDSIRLNSKAQAVSPERGTDMASAGSQALMSSGEHIARISQAVMPTAVHIQAVRREKDGRKVEETGSGVAMRSSRVNGLFVITNNHVIRGAELQDIELQTADGLELNPLRIYRDEESDIAILQIQDYGTQTGVWGDSDSVAIGHYVLAIGSPFGLSQSVTMGIVSAKSRRDLSLTEDHTVINQDFIQTDAAINPGNSGGPLIDMHGRVVGINTAIASNSGGNEGIGFSIPCNLVRHVFEQLVSYGRVQRAYLGVELDSDFDLSAARRLGLDRAYGARVTRVYRSATPTPAAIAGMRPDDVIVSFNGIPVADENHLINLVSLAEIGRSVKIEVFRGGQRQQLVLKLTDRESVRAAAIDGADTKSR
ncbi:MAG: trypsin-like peptidase domain-containing protein [Planctomycetaceae bacterium]